MSFNYSIDIIDPINLTFDPQNGIAEWCRNVFGEDKIDWDVDYVIKKNIETDVYWFKTKGELILFWMIWS